MNRDLSILFGITGVAFLLLVVNHVVRIFNRRRGRELNDRTDGLQASLLESELPPGESPAEKPSIEETAGWWWKQLLSPKAVLGLLLILLQPWLLATNSYILSVRLEILFNKPADPLFVFELSGWSREVSLYDLTGLLLSLLQMASAAVFALGIQSAKKVRWLNWSAFFVWMSAVGFEVSLSVWTGLAIEGAPVNAVLSALLALAISVGEGTCGVFIIDYFLIPFVLAIAWTTAGPFRGLAKFSGWLFSLISSEISNRRRKHPVRKEQVGSSLVGAVDSLFQPLRNLDAFTYRSIRALTAPRGVNKSCLESKSQKS